MSIVALVVLRGACLNFSGNHAGQGGDTSKFDSLSTGEIGSLNWFFWV